MSKDRDHNGELLGVAVLLVGLGLWLTARTVWRHPVATLAVVVSLGVYVQVGRWGLAALWLAVLVGLVAWRLVGRGSFDRSVSWRARGTWRGWWVYSRRWRPAMTLCDLGDRYNGNELVPRLVRVRSNEFMDRVTVKLLAGQHPGDFQDKAGTVAHTFGQLGCRVRVAGPGRAHLDFTRRDALAAPVPALSVEDPVDLSALPVGRREDGELWRVRLLGAHLLIAGVTGAGKGSHLQSIIRPLGPAIRPGLAHLFGIDPKGGMELAAAGAKALYRPWTDTHGVQRPGLVTDDPEEWAELLEHLVGLMKARARRLAGVTRLHTPTIADPLLVLVIDELAALTAYRPRSKDARDLYGRIETALNLLWSQGRAVGVSVICALQDPRKEVLPSRDLIPVRIALRLIEAEATDMVLGPNARDLGADCSLIDPTMPGVAWVWCDGEPEPTRVRASNITDDDIRWLVDHYRPAPADVVDAEVIDLHPVDEGVPA